ncbi:hypothetical protein KKG81_04835 [bacterium]|nr:hypothetical protein [bacterium]
MVNVKGELIQQKMELSSKEERTPKEEIEYTKIIATTTDLVKCINDLELMGIAIKDLVLNTVEQTSILVNFFQKIHGELVKMETSGDFIRISTIKSQEIKEKKEGEKRGRKADGISSTERKAKVNKLIEKYKESKMSNKEIIKTVSEEAGVSTTYVYNIIRNG